MYEVGLRDIADIIIGNSNKEPFSFSFMQVEKIVKARFEHSKLREQILSEI